MLSMQHRLLSIFLFVAVRAQTSCILHRMGLVRVQQ